MKKLLLLILVFTCYGTFAQNFYEHFNSDEFWQKLVLDNTDTPLPSFTAADTTIIVASNRGLATGDIRFITEVHELPDSAVRYFFVYSHDGQWHIHREASLQEAILRLPAINKDWVIYTEGMGKIFTSDLDRGMRLSGQYGVNILLMDYPSIRSNFGSLKNYKFAIGNARAAYKDFMPVLDSFKLLHQQQKTGTGSVSLFYHSMGNNVIRELILHNRLNEINDEVWVNNLILNSACVPRRNHKDWVDKIEFAQRIYIHYNNEDGTLKWARLAGFHQILGEHVKKPLSEKATYINFHMLCDRGHSNFLSLYDRPPAKQEALDHYNTLFHGNAVNVDDLTKYATSEYRGIGFTIIP